MSDTSRDNIPSQSDSNHTEGESGQASPFEAIRHTDEQGREFWSARDLAKVLGYTEYNKFQNAIQKAEIACSNSGYAVTDHFAHVSDMITVGKGAQRRVKDVHLSRYACYLCVENADPEKQIVAQAQTYFAVQTHKAEIAELREAQAKRLGLRTHASEMNKKLAEAAHDAGVPSKRFGRFQNAGYEGLYGGLDVDGIKAKKDIPATDDILDRMGRVELGANIFRITQAEDALRSDNVQGEEQANTVHYMVGRDVRDYLKQRGRRMPEDLPPEPTIKPLLDEQRRKGKRKEIGGQQSDQPSLFDRPEGDEPTGDG